MNLVVKAHRPWKVRVFWSLGILLLVAAIYAAFDYGRFVAKFDSSDAQRREEAYIQSAEELVEQIETLREEKAVLERAQQIERKAYNELDTTLKTLQTEILDLKEELAFYLGIVSPRDASRGLRLENMKIDKLGDGGHYRYKVVLTQVLKNDKLARGKVILRFEGLKNGQSVTLSLGQIDKQHKGDLNYKFKYYQNLNGEVIIPADFIPKRVHAKVYPVGRNDDVIEKTFAWPLK